MFIAAVTLASQALSAQAAESGGHTVVFDINAPTLRAALLQFGQQSGLQIVCPTEVLDGRSASKVAGELPPEAVLNQLLKDSGLRYVFVNERTVSITKPRSNPHP
jgi:iron complex outermembrane receptor protein